VRFLIDENLLPRICALLVTAGHHATHIRDHGMASAGDRQVLATAAAEGLTLITADRGDFGRELALTHAVEPSVVLLARSSRVATASTRVNPGCCSASPKDPWLRRLRNFSPLMPRKRRARLSRLARTADRSTSPTTTPRSSSSASGFAHKGNPFAREIDSGWLPPGVADCPAERGAVIAVPVR